MPDDPATLGIILALSPIGALVCSAICLLNAYSHKQPEVAWRDLITTSKATFQAHPERFLTPTGMKWLKRSKFSFAVAIAIAVLMTAASLAARLSG